jgi:hypothetical protein
VPAKTRETTSETARPDRPGLEAPPAGTSVSLLALWPWLLVLAVAANALAFVVAVANPLVQSDGWSAVDTVVRKFAEGRFELADLFVKRSALDHSQPLAKAIMLLHYRARDLDFSVDGVIGVFAAFAGLAVLWRFVRDDGRGPGATGAIRTMAFAGICAAYVSISAPVAFTWPLLTLTYASQFFVLMAVAAAWHALREPGRGLLLLALAALAMNVVADDAALVASLALALAAILHGATSGAWRNALRVAGVLVACVLLYRAGYVLFGPAMLDPDKGIPPGVLAHGVATQLRDLDAWQWVRGPLVMSVLGLRRPAGMDAASMAMLENAIVLALLAGHAWFWWQAWRGRGRQGPRFAATALMLLFYGLLAAIIVGRASVFGASYLWSPRYCLVYQWNLVALLLMGIAQIGAEPARARAPRRHAGLLALAGVLLVLQVPFAAASWSRIGQSRAYRERMAAQIGQIAARPEQLPTRCLPQIAPCRMPLEQRRRVLSFLQQNQLNLFSPAFQARHGLHPGPVRKPSIKPSSEPGAR